MRSSDSPNRLKRRCGWRMVGRCCSIWMMVERRFSPAGSACPECDYSLSELEPRLFSFNNPMGACEACDGLGQVDYFDESRVVAHPELSLASGAIKGWDARNQYYFQMLATLAQHYGFDIDAPFGELPQTRHVEVDS